MFGGIKNYNKINIFVKFLKIVQIKFFENKNAITQFYTQTELCNENRKRKVFKNNFATLSN